MLCCRKKKTEALEFGKYEEFDAKPKKTGCLSGKTVADIKCSAKIFVISTLAMFCFLNTKDANHNRTVNMPLNAGIGLLAGIASAASFVRMSSNSFTDKVASGLRNQFSVEDC